jgi:hypothetical protein
MAPAREGNGLRYGEGVLEAERRREAFAIERRPIDHRLNWS